MCICVCFINFVSFQTGFPFDDSDRDPDDSLQSTLDDIAQRHPEFADHLKFDRFPTWRRKRYGSGSSSTDKEEPRPHQQGQSSRSFDYPDNRETTSSRRFGDHSFPSGFNRFPFSHHFDDFDDICPEEKPPEVPRPQEKEKRGRKVNPNLPQHLSNTVDLGQKQAPVEESRGQRSMSAPPENRTCRNSSERDMGGYFARPNRTQPSPTPQGEKPRERIIPIHVEGRDEPIIPKNVNIETHRKDSNEYQQHHMHTQQASPQAQEFTKQTTPPAPSKAAPADHQEEQPSAPQVPPLSKNDPLEKIKSVKSDVLELMKQVETFVGTRKDKLYVYLDEMLTRNLLKLDNIETEGKDNIRTARKEAIKCIQACINKLEATAQACEQKEQKSDAAETTTTDKTEEKVELADAKKPVFKSTASIELQVPMDEAENPMEVQIEVIPPEKSKTSENIPESSKSMDVDGSGDTNVDTSTASNSTQVEFEKQSEEPKESSDTLPPNSMNASQPANETKM